MSKLGSHSLTPTNITKLMIQAGSKLVKLVDDLGPAEELLKINPNLIIIGRINSVYPDDPKRNVTAESLINHNPEEAAQIWIDIQKPKYLSNSLVRIFEGPNEPVWSTVDQMVWYGRFEAERLRLLSLMGLRGVVGNFSTGTPDITGENPLKWWLAFLPALLACLKYNGYLGLHEYNDGRLNKDVDSSGQGWNILRCVRVWNEFLFIYAPHTQVIITECGMNEFLHHTDINYLDELKWLDSQLQKYNWLIGICIFTAGSNNPAWDSFNIDGSYIESGLIDYIKSSIPSSITPSVPNGVKNMTINKLPNGDRQSTWTTLDNGQIQLSDQWSIDLEPVGSPNIWSTKDQNGTVVPSICSAVPNIVHKLSADLPVDEQNGAVHSLLLNNIDGEPTKSVLKILSDQSSSGQESQILSFLPGTIVERTVYILADSQDIPRGSSGKLESDHCKIRVWLGDQLVERDWSGLTSFRDVNGNTRCWNKFVQHYTVKSDGKVLVRTDWQSNWPKDQSGVSFFLGPDSVVIFSTPEIPVITSPDPVPTKPVITKLDFTKLKSDLLIVQNDIVELESR